MATAHKSAAAVRWSFTAESPFLLCMEFQVTCSHRPSGWFPAIQYIPLPVDFDTLHLFTAFPRFHLVPTLRVLWSETLAAQDVPAMRQHNTSPRNSRFSQTRATNVYTRRTATCRSKAGGSGGRLPKTGPVQSPLLGAMVGLGVRWNESLIHEKSPVDWFANGRPTPRIVPSSILAAVRGACPPQDIGPAKPPKSANSNSGH
jgi:hypothetical protein